MSLVDTVGSLAIASHGHQMTGVSVGEPRPNIGYFARMRSSALYKIYRRRS
jgi:hypothetical protein